MITPLVLANHHNPTLISIPDMKLDPYTLTLSNFVDNALSHMSVV